MIEDSDLLSRFVKDGCAKSFELIVRRHIGWVYSAALRMVRDPASAEDLTQSLFVLLESRAKTLKPSVSLQGWLFKTLCFLAKDSIRSDRRRRKHEAGAAIPKDAETPAEMDDAVWEQMSLLLEEGIGGLCEMDRQVVLLRFYEGADSVQISSKLGISHVAARKRISRAVKRLALFFKKKGVSVSAVLLGSLLLARTAHAAPPELVASVLSGCGANAGATIAVSLWRKTALRLMHGRRRLAVAVFACMGLLGVGLWLLLVAWLVNRPGEFDVMRTPSGGVATLEVPSSLSHLINEDFELSRPEHREVFAKYDFFKPVSRAKESAQTFDPLWWFREWYDLRNAPAAAQASGKEDHAKPEEMLRDSETGELHPLSWFEAHHRVPSFDVASSGGGGGGAGATADDRARTSSADAAPAKSSSGSERALVEVVMSASSATSYAADVPALAVIHRDPTSALGGSWELAKPARVIYTFAGENTSAFGMSGKFNGRDLNVSEHTDSNGNYIIFSGTGADTHLTVIHHQPHQKWLEIEITDTGTMDVHIAESNKNAYSLVNIIGVDEDGHLLTQTDPFPAGLSAELLAELDSIRATYGAYGPDQISFGIVDDEGRITWGWAPEPGVGMVLVAIAVMLGRRRYFR
jgi:RNA polymerase sigma factor (sigma-70 family)